MEPIWHAVLISFKAETSDTVRDLVYQLYQTLAEDCGGEDAGILMFQVRWNMDKRKGVHLFELAQFASVDALQAFRVHKAHVKVANILRECGDWLVGDMAVEV